MKILIVVAIVLGLHFSHHAYLSYGEDYCKLVYWSLPGFKIGCVLSGK